MRVQKIPSLMLMLATAGLAGCPGDTPPPAASVSPVCANCAAVGPTRYAGKGVGVWAYANQTDKPVALPISIDGLPGNDVTLVFSNDGDKAQPMPPITVQPAPAAPAAPALPQAAENRVPKQTEPVPSRADRIREFNARGWVEQLERLRANQGKPPMAQNQSASEAGAQQPSVIDARPGDQRSWYNEDDEPPQVTTLRRQVTLRDGVILNVWVEDSEYGEAQVTDAMIEALTTAYSRSGGTYDFLVDLGGPVWGAHKDAELIPGDRQPINLVILRIADEDTAGYFLAGNAFVNVPGTETARSNAAVVVFFNAQTLYPNKPGGLPAMVLTMAHESVHMQNFYRRGVTLGADYVFDTWLDEGSAIMMEDFASQRLLTGYNEVRDSRLPSYLAAPHYGCNVTAWPKAADKCDGYAVWGAWGGFLNRQLGLPFYRNLLNDKANKTSPRVLEAAIRSVRPDSGTVPELRRWAASVGALIPAAQAPARFAYPARADAGAPLPVIDLQTQVADRKLPAKFDTTLAGHAVAPVVRRHVKGTYRETVTVPPHTTVSVVIHDGKV